MANVQSNPQKRFGYKRAANVILTLEHPLERLVVEHGQLLKIAGIGPASARIIEEVLDSGVSSIVERAIEESGLRAEVTRQRGWRHHFLSRAEVRRILADPAFTGPSLRDSQADLQMHSEWSDGVPTVAELADGCIARGYTYAAVTDHSHGLSIAGGMSGAQMVEQRQAIEQINRERANFRLLQGIEANIGIDGTLDLSEAEAGSVEVVLAAPHSRLRRREDQTERLLRAIAQPHVAILAHPRGRISGVRAGIVADWPAVFSAAAVHGVAIEIDGDPSRQDLDYTLATQALTAGCLFALDSDAHTIDQLTYADIALAHARLAGVPVDRIVNCWPLERFLGWLREKR